MFGGKFGLPELLIVIIVTAIVGGFVWLVFFVADLIRLVANAKRGAHSSSPEENSSLPNR